MTTKARTYLVMEPILLIGEDLAHAIRDFDPDADVLVTMDEDEALALMQNRVAFDRAFLHSDPALALATPLGRRLNAGGTVCIFIGDRAERSPLSAQVMHRPFDSIVVATTLTELESVTP